MIKVIAFDLDDTLWEVEPILLRAEKELGEWFGRHVPTFSYDIATLRALRAELMSAHPELAGKLTTLRRSVIYEGMKRSGIGSKDCERLANEAMEVFLEARNRIELFEGAREAMAELANSFVLGALSNGNADIHRIGLADLFSFAFSAEDVGAPKPDAALFNAALSHTGVEPHEMVYVGDDPLLDVDPANRLGLRTIWVNRNDKKPPGETRADAVVDHVRKIPGILRDLG